MKTKAFKKTLSICLSLLMALGVLALPAGILPTLTANAASVWDGTWDGSGFSNNHITSAKGLAQFINNAGTGTSYSGQTVYLDVDIDLNGIDFGNISGGKNVYYSRDNYFQGTFDGQGHTIANFQMHNSDHRIGLFRSARNATFKNVTFTNAFIDDNDNNKKNGFAVVVGFGEGNLTFENVHVASGTVYGYNSMPRAAWWQTTAPTPARSTRATPTRAALRGGSRTTNPPSSTAPTPARSARTPAPAASSAITAAKARIRR